MGILGLVVLLLGSGHRTNAATGVVDLQAARTVESVPLQGARSPAGTATLINLNPVVGSWYLLGLDRSEMTQPEWYHLENPHPERRLTLLPGGAGAVVLGVAGVPKACELRLGKPGGPTGELEEARRSGLPFAPICGGQLYLRNVVVGRSSALEKMTDFLRDHVWGGEKIVTLVKEQLYRDAFLEQANPQSSSTPPLASADAPAPARMDSSSHANALVPPDLGIAVQSPSRVLIQGTWYGVRDLRRVFLSVLTPDLISPEILGDHSRSVAALDGVESRALAYLVAFDLADFDLHFAVGTEHPRVGWSPRPPPGAMDPGLAGPDGFDATAPLARAGMVSPAMTQQVVATFAGGFKRDHGAFRYGALSLRNHGSHYGFMEEGVLLSTLQPGLATLYTTRDGDVAMRTWTTGDAGLLPQLRDARQNGVPLIEENSKGDGGIPGPWVNRWGEGNWSGSVNESLRTVRAGACLQESGGRRYLLFAYFSAATPSAMARVFQAYQCRYAMQLDLNALEHTYFALYVTRGNERVIEHLIDGMEVLDKKAHGEALPRFLAFPDDRDFFYVTRKNLP